MDKSYDTFSIGDYSLQSGETIKDAYIAYKTYGTLNSQKSNVILYPTWYSGYISDNEWLIGKNRSLNPEKYFIIVVCLLGNGQSYSSNFLNKISLYDNVVAQHRLISEHFGIKKIKLVIGWSMGAQQTYQWASLYPEMVENAIPFAGSAKTAPHNFVFLDGLRSILNLPGIDDNKRLSSFGRVYAGWGLTQTFYKLEKWKELGYKSLEDFLVGFWEHFFLKRKPQNLATHLWTWQHGDISDNPIYNGDIKAALNGIKARVLILSPENDLYFPKEDNMDEVKFLKNGELVVIPGVWGHFAGGGINEEDTEFIDNQIKRILEN